MTMGISERPMPASPTADLRRAVMVRFGSTMRTVMTAMPTIMMPAPTDVMMLSVAMDLFGLAKRTAMMAMELIPTPVSIIAKLLNAATAFYARIFLSMKLVMRSVMTVMVMMQIIVLITAGVPNVVMGFVVQILPTTIPTMKRAMMTTILM